MVQVILNEATWRIIFNDPCIRSRWCEYSHKCKYEHYHEHCYVKILKHLCQCQYKCKTMKVEEETIREMEFGDAYDSIPAQVWPYLKWNWNDFFASILFLMKNYRFRIETSSSLTLEHFLTSNRLAKIVTLPWSWQKSTNLVQCSSSKNPTQ